MAKDDVIDSISSCDEFGQFPDLEIDGEGVLKKYKGTGGDVVIPDGVTAIGNYVFDGCRRLTSVIIPDSVTIVGDWAFNHCTGLTNVTIPSSVLSIGKYAFNACHGLTSITIPESVTLIGDGAFDYCNGLTMMIVDKNNDKYYSEGNCIIEKSTGKLILGCAASVIPDGVKSIGDYAFDSCDHLAKVTIPNTVTSIGYRAFKGCVSLTSIAIANGVKSIKNEAFAFCMPTSITIPESVIYMGYAFLGCPELSDVTVEEGNEKYYGENNCIIEKNTKKLILGCKNSIIPDGVTAIGDRAFAACSALENIAIPGGVKSFGFFAFGVCSRLASIEIPGSVILFDRGVFSSCEKLTEIHYHGSRQQWDKIEKGENWNYNTGEYKVYCIDGVLSKMES